MAEDRKSKRHGTGALHRGKQPFPGHTCGKRVEILLLRRKPGQTDNVQIDDLRRPVKRRSDGEIGSAVAQRQEFARRVARRKRGPRVDAEPTVPNSR